MTGDESRAAGPAAVHARPVRLRRFCLVAAGVIVLGSALLAFLPRASDIGATVGLPDRFGLFGLGVVVAAGVIMVSASSVEADEHGLRVRNVVVRRELSWPAVRSVLFRDRSPWASLELVDDETVALMAVQVLDGEAAVETVRALRTLLVRSAAARPAGQPAEETAE